MKIIKINILILFFICSFISISFSSENDTDGDGLSDFQEINKYFTAPNKKDTEGKGLIDGDWKQRREYTYSIRAIIRVMPPVNIDIMNDDYQDAKIIKKTKNYIEIEVILYPYNTNKKSIRGNPNWQDDYIKMTSYLKPGITTNWDDKMKKDLLSDLIKNKINIKNLNDKETAENVAEWISKSYKYISNMFCTYYVYFTDGEMKIFPGLEKQFMRDKGDPNWSVQEQFEHEIYGKSMFYNRTAGSCTSFAIYQTTIFKALGIPARMIIGIPIADTNDPAQIKMIAENIKNNEIREYILTQLKNAKGFTAHTSNEVYIGNRWRRLNYKNLGDNILTNALGLQIHLMTFNDLSEANLAATLGKRYAKGERNNIFKYSNPYSLIEITEYNGKYSKIIINDTVKYWNISKIYWFNSKERPKNIANDWVKKNGDGHILIHAEKNLEEVKDIYNNLSKEFLLVADNIEPIKIKAERGFWTFDNGYECYMRIDRLELKKMKIGVKYKLKSINEAGNYKWKIDDQIYIIKEN